ncbi:recombinase family protein [Streptomyces sp. W1SF4]|uniref:recombinase family protein n=1 Tax=Streptomyces sp. W1SF4 TaxID=2305220 RepID=UPI000F6FCD1B|nr:recombinase family protein [Streptomyces sp. W1SF4]AZM91419.1 recombinase family protein [Streptomyces sp. W1SF4]
MTALTTPSGRRVIRCYAYARISSDREGAGLGVTRQFEDIDALVHQLSTPQAEYRIVDYFEDNDLSAYSGKPRPDYLRMLQGMRAGGTDCILAWHTDRLHRRPLELEEYIDVCEPRQIDTRTVKAGHLDLSTATGRMIARQLGVQARYEVERMIERQKRAREQMAQHGKHFGGRRPFGWEIDGLTPIDEEVTHIQYAAQAILAGASLRSVAAEWNERGVKTSTGGEWGPNEVKKMLARPRNAGIREHRGQEVAAAQWPAALDEATWRSVVKLLTDPARRTNVGRTARVSLGTGIYTCGECGKPVISGTCGSGPVKNQMPAYRCLGHVSRRRDLVDDMVQLAVLERLSRPDASDLLLAREEPVDVQGAQEDMKEARELLDELSAALGRGEMDLRSWSVASAGAKKRVADAEALLSRAVSVNPVAGLVLAEDVEAAWNALDLSRRRAVLSYLVTVTIYRARRGRQPGGGYWDSDSVRIGWK